MDATAAPREIVTRTERIWLDAGIIRCVVLSTPSHTLADAHENTLAVTALAAGRRVPMLLDTRASRGLDRDARLYYVRPEAAQLLTALALLIDSQMGRMFGNFYMRVNRPPFPICLFNAEADATTWLKGHIP